MRCPKCGNLEDKVIDSRSAKAGAAIRRRRECLACQHRFTTYEEIERRDLRVIKRDGRHEPFERQKLLSGMIKACEKRPVGYDALERAAEEIIQELEQSFDHEVPTSAIGIRVMERLHSMDEVAYIRYASVYRQFQDIGEFINEIESLGRKIKRNALTTGFICPVIALRNSLPLLRQIENEDSTNPPRLALLLRLSSCGEGRVQPLVAGGTCRSECDMLPVDNV